MTIKSKIAGALALALASVATTATAAPVYFTDRSAFLSQTANLTTEDFSGLISGSAPSVDFGDVTIQEIGGAPNLVGRSTSADPFGLGFNTDSAVLTDEGSSVAVLQAFSGAFNAFGIDVSANANTRVRVVGDGFFSSFQVTAGTPTFFGVIVDTDIQPGRGISFVADGAPIVGFDNLVYGDGSVSAVPVPAAFPLLVASIIGLGFVARRRTSNNSC